MITPDWICIVARVRVKESCLGRILMSVPLETTLIFYKNCLNFDSVSDTFFASRRRPCLQYQIGRCTAPCVDWVSKTEYAAQVKQVKLYLSGNNEAVVETLQDQMQRFARQKQYEKAAEVRDKIAQIREITQRRSTALKAGDVDVFSVLQKGR